MVRCAWLGRNWAHSWGPPVTGTWRRHDRQSIRRPHTHGPTFSQEFPVVLFLSENKPRKAYFCSKLTPQWLKCHEYLYVVIYFMSCLSAPSRIGENIYPCTLSTSGAWWHTDPGFEWLQAEHRLKTSPWDSIFHSESTQSCTHVAKSFIVARPGWFSSQKRPCLAKIPRPPPELATISRDQGSV